MITDTQEIKLENVLNYIENNKEKHLSELFELLSIKSISSLPEHDGDTLDAAEWMVNNIKSIGISNVELHETKGHPVIFAERIENPSFETVLIYGHYDVQPVDPLDLWHSDPFKPEIRDGKIYCRGSSDDKGQLFAHIKALEAILATNGNLPVNIKLLIEGEEECGSDNLEHFIRANTEKLKCDLVLISDTEWFSEELPSICYSLRGISYVEVYVKGPNRDLHSGTYGGAVDNPINVLCNMIARLKDNYGKITIPGFYDDVAELTEEERKGFLELPFDLDAYKKDLDIAEVYGENGYTTIERASGRPTLDINGIKGGFIGSGAKTVLPSEASAKISMRLVPNQNASDITGKISRYLKEIAPATVKVEVSVLHGGNPVMVPRDGKGVKAATTAMEKAFGKTPAFTREGGSIPIVELFGLELNAPTVLMAFGLPGDNIHSPNESFALANYHGGIKASVLFFDEYIKL